MIYKPISKNARGEISFFFFFSTETREEEWVSADLNRSKVAIMGWIGETVDSIKSIKIRQLLTQAITLGSFRFHWFKPQLLFGFNRVNELKGFGFDWGLRYDRDVCIDNMEVFDVCDWHWVSSGRCSLGKHGTWL